MNKSFILIGVCCAILSLEVLAKVSTAKEVSPCVYNLTYPHAEGLELSAETRKVRWEGTEFDLPELQFYLLEALVENSPTPMSQQGLAQFMIESCEGCGDGITPYMPQLINVLINALRTKFKSINPMFDKIKNKKGVGYVWQNREPDIVKPTKLESIVFDLIYPSSGDLALSSAAKMVRWKGVNISLNESQFLLLRRLIERSPAPISVDEIEDHINTYCLSCGDTVTDSREIIRKIRRKFLKVDPSFDRIKSLYDVGYSWDNGDVGPAVKFGRLTVYPDKLLASWEDKSPVSLTKTEVLLLLKLINVRGRLVDRSILEQLLQETDRAFGYYSLIHHFKRIRDKFKAGEIVISIKSLGYQLNPAYFPQQ